MNQNQNQNEFQVYHGGKGIFYGVIAVATLVVAIIGATFAYFTATAQSSENALAAQAAHVQVDYTEGRQIRATNLIPSSASVVKAAYAQPTAAQTASATDAEGDVGTKCVDENGYFVCAVYEFSVTNSSNVKQQLSAYMTINTNGFITTDTGVNIGETGAGSRALKVMVVRSETVIDVTAINSKDNTTTCNWGVDEGLSSLGEQTSSTKFCTSTGANDVAHTTATFEDSTGIYYFFNTTATRQSIKNAGENQDLFVGDVIPAISTSNLDENGQVIWLDEDGNPTTVDSEKVSAKGAQTMTYYVVVWLEETNKDQDDDQDAQFAATIHVQSTGSGAAGGNVTGTMAGA